MDPIVPSSAPRSGAPKVMGILSIIFGSLGILGGVFGALGMLAGKGLATMGSAMPATEANKELPEMLSVMSSLYMALGVQSLIKLGVCVLLLVVGIGQVKYRPWAARWSKIWGLVGLGGVVVLSVVQLLVVTPVFERMMSVIASGAKAGVPNLGAMGAFLGGASIISTVLFYAPYPIITLVLFSRPKVVDSLNRA